MSPNAFDAIKIALSAYNNVNRQANRLWALSAATATLILVSDFHSADPRPLGMKINPEFVQPLLVILLAGTNIVYCVAHASVYRIGTIYQSIINEHFRRGQKLSAKFSWYDLAQRAPISNYNRIYPLVANALSSRDDRAYKIIKKFYDFIFCFFPASALFYGLINLQATPFLLFLSISCGTISIFFSALLLSVALRWPQTDPD